MKEGIFFQLQSYLFYYCYYGEIRVGMLKSGLGVFFNFGVLQKQKSVVYNGGSVVCFLEKQKNFNKEYIVCF